MDNIKINASYIQSPLIKGDQYIYTTPIRLFYLIYNLQRSLYLTANLRSMNFVKKVGK